jgi:hypothetical protein
MQGTGALQDLISLRLSPVFIGTTPNLIHRIILVHQKELDSKLINKNKDFFSCTDPLLID